MGRMQRNKGARGERELFAILSDEIGFTVARALGAARDGGCDTLDIPGWSPEVKRTEVFISAFWRQTCEQAEQAGRRPVRLLGARVVGLVDASVNGPS